MTPESLMLRSLIEGPLLLDDLPEATTFPHRNLSLPAQIPELRFGQKLGHLYEDALSCLLEASSSYQLLERNLQIQKNRHETVGELDFLIRDLRTATLIHLELATKFYLVVRNSGEVALPGPDARDNYFKKLHRLRSHQLQLTTRHRDHLPSQYRDKPIEPRHLIYGCLFDHIHDKNPHIPGFLNSEARRGKWVRLDELPPVPNLGMTFKLIPKPLWPLPFGCLRTIDLKDFPIPPCLDQCVMVMPSKGECPWFITPTGYPHLPPGSQKTSSLHQA